MTAIVQLGAPVLRELAQPITEFNSVDTQQFIQKLLSTLSISAGVGLAAPQIGISYQIIVIASKPTSRYPQAELMSPLVMINPEFQPLSTTINKDWEGCLSIPGIRALVPRYNDIEVNYINISGIKQQTQLHGFIARIFQHEYDHLQGLVYLDRVENNRDIISETEFLQHIAA
ncbi:MAG: hypothetical protein RL637_592 [Pseudomonadota bacterium]